MRGQSDPFDLLQQIPNIIERIAIPVAGIVHVARHARRGGRLQTQRRHVLHVSEIPRLFTVAEDRGRRALDQGFQEQR